MHEEEHIYLGGWVGCSLVSHGSPTYRRGSYALEPSRIKAHVASSTVALVLVGLKRVERRSFSTYRICTYTRRVKAKATHEDVHHFPFRTTTRMCNALP